MMAYEILCVDGPLDGGVYIFEQLPRTIAWPMNQKYIDEPWDFQRILEVGHDLFRVGSKIHLYQPLKEHQQVFIHIGIAEIEELNFNKEKDNGKK